MTLVPAYGRDYKNKAAILADLNGGKDFKIADISNPDCGRYINNEDLEFDDVVNIRYKNLTEVLVVRKKGGIWTCV